MDRNTLLLFLLLPVTCLGQTYYYIDHITVAPPAPTTTDPITITLVGNLSATNSYIVPPTSFTLLGTDVNIVVNAGSSGIGSPTLVPHNESFPLGTLPAGTYTINVTGAFTGDFAPVGEHTFVVSGGGSPCDSVEIADVHWAPFSDTALVVHVYNNSSELFDYPGWILFNDLGDTLAMETVNFFGIAGESWHTLAIHPGAAIPVGTFNGSLELWTGFYTELACTFDWTGDPCPDTCVVVYPQMINNGGSLVSANIDWWVTDADGTTVGSGQFEFDALNQYVIDSLCLVPGAYTLLVNHGTAVGGDLSFWLNTAGLAYGTNPQTFIQDGTPDLMPFNYFPACFDDTNGLVELEPTVNWVLTTANGTLHVHTTDGTALGALELLDLRGRAVHAATASGPTADLDVARLTPGLYVLRAVERSWRSRVLLD